MPSTVRVVATTFDGTRAALAAAVPLAKGSEARVVVSVPRIVSCAAELDSPSESAELLAARYRELVQALGDRVEIEICGSVGLDDFVSSLCAERSLVVIVGGPVGRWLTSPEERFANRLALSGCQVLFAPSGPNTTQRRVAA